jgi:squalene synthase HpnC
MSAAQDLLSGKGHRDENFPVASILIEPRNRAPVMVFYRFARTADDVADDRFENACEKLRLLEEMRGSLLGEHDQDASAVALRRMLAERQLPATHALDLLEAFRRDASKSRYADWDELMDYCRYSAAPVGRMVLDIHGEAQTTWPASDALCAALQIINHLQDCGKDYRELDRVYLPETELAAAGLDVSALGQPAASPALGRLIASLAGRTRELLRHGRPLAGQVRNRRLRLEIAFIQRVAEDLAERLMTRDPLSQRVHHRKLELVGLAASALARVAHEPAARREIETAPESQPQWP